MTKIRFVLLAVFALIITLWGIVFGGNDLALYLDLPSLIITPIAPYIVASFIYPFSLQSKFNKEIFKTDKTCDKSTLEHALAYFNLLKKLTIAGAVLGIFIGFIGIMAFLSELNDLVSIGRNIGVMAICPFYATVFIFAVIEPLKGAVKKNLIG